jgi:hypothetical protein
LGRGRGPVKGTRERNERADQSTYIHVWKCHDKTHYLVQLIYTNKNKLCRVKRWVGNKSPSELGIIKLTFDLVIVSIKE